MRMAFTGALHACCNLFLSERINEEPTSYSMHCAKRSNLNRLNVGNYRGRNTVKTLLSISWTVKGGVVVLSFFVALLSGMACAAPLLEKDLFVHDDGKITFDPHTRLQWLDLTETLGLSIYDVRAGAGPAGGWISGLGFRYATVAEVETLFIDAGFPDVNSATAANVPFYDSFAALLNTPCTSVQPRIPADCASPFGFTGTVSDLAGTVSELERYAMADLRFFPLGGADASTPCCTPVAFPRTIGINGEPSFTNANLGHWLVRTVPEPSTNALLGLALAGVAYASRKKLITH
jgi:hypothetical protein